MTALGMKDDGDIVTAIGPPVSYDQGDTDMLVAEGSMDKMTAVGAAVSVRERPVEWVIPEIVSSVPGALIAGLAVVIRRINDIGWEV